MDRTNRLSGNQPCDPLLQFNYDYDPLVAVYNNVNYDDLAEYHDDRTEHDHNYTTPDQYYYDHGVPRYDDNNDPADDYHNGRVHHHKLTVRRYFYGASVSGTYRATGT